MKKKIVVQMMGVVLAAGLMAGCGGTSEDKNASGTATESTKDAESTQEAESTKDTESTKDAENTQDAENTADETKDSEEDVAENENEKGTDGDIGSVISAAGWNITVEDVEINSSLENVSVSLGYTGVETNDYKKEADAGKTFCLIKMKIEKDGSKENFDWANLKLKDSEGNEYTRVDDDFISELGMTRMAGTALNFGSNEGWIAFEIGEDSEGLELDYAFEAEEYHCAL